MESVGLGKRVRRKRRAKEGVIHEFGMSLSILSFYNKYNNYEFA